MSKFDKAKKRILSKPRDYTYSDAKSLLEQLGFVESTKGKTSGSRRKFYRQEDKMIILLHKPHPGDIMKISAVNELVDKLIETGDLL